MNKKSTVPREPNPSTGDCPKFSGNLPLPVSKEQDRTPVNYCVCQSHRSHHPVDQDFAHDVSSCSYPACQYCDLLMRRLYHATSQLYCQMNIHDCTMSACNALVMLKERVANLIESMSSAPPTNLPTLPMCDSTCIVKLGPSLTRTFCGTEGQSAVARCRFLWQVIHYPQASDQHVVVMPNGEHVLGGHVTVMPPVKQDTAKPDVASPRHKRPKAQDTNMTYWNCMHCNFSNPNSREGCLNCYTSRDMPSKTGAQRYWYREDTVVWDQSNDMKRGELHKAASAPTILLKEKTQMGYAAASVDQCIGCDECEISDKTGEKDANEKPTPPNFLDPI